MTEIVLHAGLNHVDDFASDGHPGDILVAWRENGNAWGYTLFVVTIGNGVVGIEDKSLGLMDVLRDEPHNFEDTVRSVRFARSRADGKWRTLLIVATRNISQGRSLADSARVIFQLFELRHVDSIGSTEYAFKQISSDQSKEMFCNADKAIEARFGLPLPAGYQGGSRNDGCP